MSDFSDTYGNYLKAADLQGRAWDLTIHDARVEEFNRPGQATGDKQRKLILSFEQTTKELICNATNARTLADAFTANTDALAGKQIKVEPYMTNMGLAIRVTVPVQPARAVRSDPFVAGPAAPGNSGALPAPGTQVNDPPPAGVPFDDAIPF